MGWATVELLTMANSDYSKSLRDEFLRIVEEDGEKIFVCQDSDNEYVLDLTEIFEKKINLF